VSGTAGPISSYLAEIAARLEGPARARRDILAELRAGLADATDSYRAAGLDQAGAARSAIAEFGGPERVAAGFREELAAAQARRTAFALLTSGPVIGTLWAIAASASHLGARAAPPWEWASMPAGARLIAHIALFVLPAAIGSALVTVGTTGSLTRWLPARPAAVATVAAGGTAAMDLTLLAVLATLTAASPGRLALLPVAVAAAASLTRCALATRAARACSRLCT
jgi:HAAS